MPLPAEAVKYLMMQQGVTEKELATRTELSVVTVHRLLGSPMSLDMGHWSAILDALELEVRVRVKKEEASAR